MFDTCSVLRARKDPEAEAAFANSGLDPDEGTSWHYAGNECVLTLALPLRVDTC